MEHIFIANLLNKAKEKVMSDGYQFVKGKSRSKSGTEEETEGPAKKRAKLNSQERSREIKLLEENQKTLTDRIGFKERQLEKERCMNNFKQCDTISIEMIKIRKERMEVERQLSALMKKEAKSTWYKKKSTKIFNKRDSQIKIPSLLQKSYSSTSSSTDDTLIASDENNVDAPIRIVSDDGGRDSATSGDEIPSSQRKRDFTLVPPEMKNQEEGM